MTTHLASQERPCRSAPVAADELRSHTSAVRALEVSIERRPESENDAFSEADAAWPRRLRRIARASLFHWGRPDLVETVELLLTELATNALRHGGGLDVGVRLSMQDDHITIEVNDGSPVRPVLRNARFDDEGGRGLLLVEAMAKAWGVSDDGSITWCTVPLTKGPEVMQPAAATAPVLREIPMELPGDRSAADLARIQARTLLTVAAWPGDQHWAVDVLHRLVDNAWKHAVIPGEVNQRFAACLSITEAHELIIDVTDPVPLFLDFDQAVASGSGRGLWEIARKGVDLSWFVVGDDFSAKTVRAVLRAGAVEL
ncbi:ATP-binding protein [Streptomyces chartreusis]|uniref:ATP-binding protein n=1 Tax=Streptomyces chartreusis TaxID=1969 RepID=A0A7H8TP32_STRCX|nr:ATP-binding protein [Streptomyces chartreusis]QKZ23880.1 ATP-binding protein [Streptomyces chartreusis]